MTWFGWVLIALHATGALVTISLVGKPRPATTTGVAVASTVIGAAVIVGVLTVGTGAL